MAASTTTNSFSALFLPVQHARQQHARAPTMERPGSIAPRSPLPSSLARTLRDEAADLGGLLVRLIGHTQSAAQVDMADGAALGAQPLHQRQHAVDGFQDRVGVHQLRADVAAHALGRQVRQIARALIDGFGVRNVDTEFVFAQAGRNIRMRGSVYIGIHADGEARLHAAPRRQRIDQRQLRLRTRN